MTDHKWGSTGKDSETIRSFKEISEGKHDDKPEMEFYMKGAL